MGLEVKHLAPYLPYGLKLQYVVREKVEKTGIMKTIIHNEDETHPTKVSIDWNDSEHIWMFKPILRPLKEIQNEIENFENIQYYGSNYENGQKIDGFSFGGILTLSIDDFQKLLSMHFDVFGLISKGLAVDINTLSVE